MNDINNLLTRYSLQELVVIIIMLLFAGQALWKLAEFYYEKHQIHIGKKIDSKKFENDIIDSLKSLDGKIDELHTQNMETHQKQEQVDQTLALVQERMQENTRSYLIDAHHKFCYQFKKIDDLNLQSIERRYLYYKTAGGDTFIDHLMEEVRALPRINFYSENSTNIIA